MTELEELQNEIAELRQRVDDMENRIARHDNGDSKLLDEYDAYVMDRVESVSDANPRRLMRLYKESGVLDKEKRKTRSKRLKQVKGGE